MLFNTAFWPCRLSALELALPPDPAVEARLPAKQSFVTALTLTAPKVEASARVFAAPPPAGTTPQLDRQLKRASEVAEDFWQIFATVTQPWFEACGIRRLVLRGQVRDLARQPLPEALDLGDRHPAA